MTPEEIVNNIVNNVVSEDDTKAAIEAILQYAKQMCDKQKIECSKAYFKAPAVVFEYQAITNAPYPEELL